MTIRAARAVGLSTEDLREVCELLAAVLHLGDVTCAAPRATFEHTRGDARRRTPVECTEGARRHPRLRDPRRAGGAERGRRVVGGAESGRRVVGGGGLWAAPSAGGGLWTCS
eukprot:7111937-Prymnesium_polylepis.1